MKKMMAACLCVLAIVGCGVTSKPQEKTVEPATRDLEAQALGNFCCNSYGYRVCGMSYPQPLGSLCGCVGVSGYGYVCY